MVSNNTVNELVDALSVPQQSSSNVYNAVVANIDNEGVVWVHVEGSSKVTPTASKVAEVSQGDHVSVEWRNNKLYISGNYTTPATDDTRAIIAETIANGAQQAVTTLNTLVANTIIADDARFTNLEADTAKIHNLTANELSATVGYIDDLTTGNVSASDIVADHAAIEDLDVQSMSAATAYIGALTAGNVTAQNLIADHGTIGSLDSNYAEIDLANVNNAWIQNGVVKDAAISDAQIIGVSANKLTAGTIDASNITVTNLNASNITTGSLTVDGITIDVTNNEASIDGSYIEDGTITLNGLAQEVTDKIDGAIETFTGTVVPTLNNYPASSWTTSAIKDTHIGDVYYVINAGNQADGYCYRFAKSGSTYQWVLIKDSDVTAALQRLTEAEGDIAGLESFESTTSSWITETDEELSSLKTNVTSLTTRVGEAEDEIETKVDTSTFNTLSQTVGENSANITTLTTITTNNGLTSSTNISNTVNNVSQKATSNESKISNLTTVLGTNADGTTKSTDIVHQVSDISQDLSGITTRVGKTEVQIKGSYATSSTAKGTTAKTATIVPAVTGWELYPGATITVKFTNENTATSPTLNVNLTGAKGIRTYSGGTLSEDERKWPAGATMSFVYDGEYWRIQDSTELTRLSAAETTIAQTANNVLIKATENDTTAAQGGQHIIQSLINVAPSGVTISADKVNIEGATIFTGNGRLSQTSLDNAYEEHGAVADLVTDLASSSGTTVINGGHITTGSISIGQVDDLQDGLDSAAQTASKYITFIDNTNGIRVYDGQTSNQNVNFAQINSSGMQIYKGGSADANKVAEFGETAQIGKNNTGHTTISSSGMQVYGSNGTIELANIGYGPGVNDSGTSGVNAPYYTFGVRKSNSEIGNYSMAVGYNVTAANVGSYAEGYNTIASGRYSHAEGQNVIADGDYSHAEGRATLAIGDYSHAEGTGTQANGDYSHTEGRGTQANDDCSHAEGYSTVANSGSHAEGYSTVANSGSHAEGYSTVASGSFSHASGQFTIALEDYQTTIGKYNKATVSGSGTNADPYTYSNVGDYAFIIGNGTDNTTSDRSNALTVDWNGNVDITSGAKYKINGIALAPSDLGEADFITSQGSSGSWYYRKWNSGKVEAWYRGNVSCSAATAVNNVYRSTYSLTIPSGIFSSAPIINLAIDQNASTLMAVQGYASSSTEISGYVFRTGSQTSTYNTRVSVYAWTD